MFDQIVSMLGNDADSLLQHVCKTIPKEVITSPSPEIVNEVYAHSDRNNQTLKSLQWLLGTGRLANTGYTSI
jgi:class I fructose-bisphosphate aldolase